jgi:hypothetical protein
VGERYSLEKYQQLSNRHAPPLIRHVLFSFWQKALTATEAAVQLGLSLSRFYALSTAYLQARARKKEDLWIPGTSGGDHAAVWPEAVTDLLKKRLSCSPPCPYSFAASEALRLHSFKLDRAQVRHWAIQNGCAHPTPPQRPGAPLAALPDRRTLAIGRFPPSLVPRLRAGLSHAQYARRLQPLVRRLQNL